MIKIQKTEEDRPSITFSRGPRKGLDKLIEATKELKERYVKYKEDIDANRKGFKFDRDLYAHSEIKKKLITLQHKKCCFCEAKVTHIAYGDIEHFRPKAAYKQVSGQGYQYPGYFWLAYEWSNLFFSCQLCNQRHKKNLFPLLDATTRVLNHDDDVSDEEHLFLDPVKDDPEKHITFYNEIPIPLQNSERGKHTIESLGLDRPDLNEDRLTHLGYFLNMLRIMEYYPRIPEFEEHHNDAKLFLKQNIFEKMKPDAEYSLMFKVLYEKKIKAVIED